MKMKMKKSIAALLILALLTMTALAEGGANPIEVGIATITQSGNLVLNISGTGFLEQGYEYGDVVTVTVYGQDYDMPICDDYNEVDMGEPVIRVQTEAGRNYVVLALTEDNLAVKMGLAVMTLIDEEPGYRWDYVDSGAPVLSIALKEKAGYLEQYELRKLHYTNERADYPDLTDAEYANFRNVATTGMGAGALYRSSSPINPAIHRNLQADEALNAAGIQTILNLADNRTAIRGFEDYKNTYYAQRNVILIPMDNKYHGELDLRQVARGVRFIIENDGPYLIHCKEGKDRTGFMCVLLEALMGADYKEIAADYMVTYTNYYGMKPGSEKYEFTLNSMISSFPVTEAGEVGSSYLRRLAESYLRDCGLTGDEIEALKVQLARDWTK